MRELLKHYRGPDDPSGYEGRWRLKINRYQRDNLVWLFNIIGYGAPGIWPFTMANNGDWVGEIPQMLTKPTSDNRASFSLDEHDHPNGQSVEKAREALERELSFRLHMVLMPDIDISFDGCKTDGHLVTAKAIVAGDFSEYQRQYSERQNLKRGIKK